MKVVSYGAAKTVTGSCHLLDGHWLFDCGLFQGSKELEERNQRPLGFDPAKLRAVFLSHAHLDHCGRLPLLLRQGFAGPIFALPATRELAQYLLLDAVRVQREEFEKRRGNQPLYNEGDVQKMLKHFVDISYHQKIEVDELTVTAQKAGHVPGSASFLAETSEGRFVFSGDLGNAGKTVMPPPEFCPEADLVLIESTYGNRDHKPFQETIEEFASLIRQTVERRGKLIIPSFALERTQDLLYQLARLEEQNRVPALPVFVDSPLATKVERVYDRWKDEFSQDVQNFFSQGLYPFAPERLRYTSSTEESKALNVITGPVIIIAGAGMLSGGRVLHHLRHNLPDPHTTVAMVGYQPSGGLGQLLIDGANTVKILGENVRVKAKIVTIGGFSAHAGQTELINWLKNLKEGTDVRLVHGEIESMGVLKSILDNKYKVSLQEPA